MAEWEAVFLHDAALDRDGYPEACPFNTRRAGKTLEMAQSMGFVGSGGRAVVAPQRLTREELERFHTPAYLDGLRRAGDGELHPDEALRFGLGTPDCPIFRGMYDYVALAAGGSVTGARLILEGRTRYAFNPSGGFHHAQPANAAGFCYVNDIVLAALELADAGKRVFFLDIDVHHCDAVQDAFYARRDIMTASLHESGTSLFPGTGFAHEAGVGEGEGYTLNIPLPVGAYDRIYERAFREGVLPVLRAYDPDVIILEIGMDPLAGDPLAHLHLTNNVPADIVTAVRGLGKPVLATGGGGYHVENTVRGWALCWSALCGEDHTHDLAMGLGGVMLETSEWAGGLRDRVLLSDAGRRDEVDAEVMRAVAEVKRRVFPHHGLA